MEFSRVSPCFLLPLTLPCSLVRMLRLCFPSLTCLVVLFSTLGTSSANVSLQYSAPTVPRTPAEASGPSEAPQDGPPGGFAAGAGLLSRTQRNEDRAETEPAGGLGVSASSSVDTGGVEASVLSRGLGYETWLNTVEVPPDDTTGARTSAVLASRLSFRDDNIGDGSPPPDSSTRSSFLRGLQNGTATILRQALAGYKSDTAVAAKMGLNASHAGQGRAVSAGKGLQALWASLPAQYGNVKGGGGPFSVEASEQLKNQGRSTLALLPGNVTGYQVEDFSQVVVHSRRLSDQELSENGVSGSAGRSETPGRGSGAAAGERGAGHSSSLSDAVRHTAGQPERQASTEASSDGEALTLFSSPGGNTDTDVAASGEAAGPGNDEEGARAGLGGNGTGRGSQSLSAFSVDNGERSRAASGDATGASSEEEGRRRGLDGNGTGGVGESLSNSSAGEVGEGRAESAQAADTADEEAPKRPGPDGKSIAGEQRSRPHSLAATNDKDGWESREAADPSAGLSGFSKGNSGGDGAGSQETAGRASKEEGTRAGLGGNGVSRETDILPNSSAVNGDADGRGQQQEAGPFSAEEGSTPGPVGGGARGDDGTWSETTAGSSEGDRKEAVEPAGTANEEEGRRPGVGGSGIGPEDEILEGAIEEDDDDDDDPHPVEDPKQKLFVQFIGGHSRTVAATMIGRRPTDEDAIAVNVPLKNIPHAFLEAVFDGHGGAETAQYLAVNAMQYFGTLKDLDPATIRRACAELDEAIVASPEVGWSGSTGVLVFTEVVERPQEVMVAGREIIPESGATEFFVPLEDLICQDEMTTALRTNKPVPPCVPPAGVERTRIGVEDKLFKITVANVGDSRALLLHSDGTFTRLSRDHKPNVASEATRILSAGGYVDYTDTFRVNGVISLSRAFGDREMKMNPDLPAEKQLLVAVPEVRSFYARTSDVLLLACDGLFEPDEMTHDFVARLLYHEIKQSPAPDYQTILASLLDKAYDLNSEDNISGLISVFSPTFISPASQHFFALTGTGESIPERKRDVVLPEEGPQETLLRDPAAVISRSKAPDDSSSEDSMLDEDGASSEDLLDGVQASPDGLDEESVSR